MILLDLKNWNFCWFLRIVVGWLVLDFNVHHPIWRIFWCLCLWSHFGFSIMRWVNCVVKDFLVWQLVSQLNSYFSGVEIILSDCPLGSFVFLVIKIKIYYVLWQKVISIMHPWNVAYNFNRSISVDWKSRKHQYYVEHILENQPRFFSRKFSLTDIFCLFSQHLNRNVSKLRLKCWLLRVY